jgi:hypothetical protein
MEQSSSSDNLGNSAKISVAFSFPRDFFPKNGIVPAAEA